MRKWPDARKHSTGKLAGGGDGRSGALGHPRPKGRRAPWAVITASLSVALMQPQVAGSSEGGGGDESGVKEHGGSRGADAVPSSVWHWASRTRSRLTECECTLGQSAAMTEGKKMEEGVISEMGNGSGVSQIDAVPRERKT